MQLAMPIVRLLSMYTPVLGPRPRAHYDFIKMLSAKIRIFRTFVRGGGREGTEVFSGEPALNRIAICPTMCVTPYTACSALRYVRLRLRSSSNISGSGNGYVTASGFAATELARLATNWRLSLNFN